MQSRNKSCFCKKATKLARISFVSVFLVILFSLVFIALALLVFIALVSLVFIVLLLLVFAAEKTQKHLKHNEPPPPTANYQLLTANC